MKEVQVVVLGGVGGVGQPGQRMRERGIVSHRAVVDGRLARRQDTWAAAAAKRYVPTLPYETYMTDNETVTSM